MRCWRRVRRAKIPQMLRDEFEQYGEAVIVGALTSIIDGASTPMQALILKWRDQCREEALAWLTERRDIHEQHEQRLETVEWAILIFVMVGVMVDLLLLVHGK